MSSQYRKGGGEGGEPWAGATPSAPAPRRSPAALRSPRPAAARQEEFAALLARHKRNGQLSFAECAAQAGPGPPALSKKKHCYERIIGYVRLCPHRRPLAPRLPTHAPR